MCVCVCVCVLKPERQKWIATGKLMNMLNQMHKQTSLTTFIANTADSVQSTGLQKAT